MKKLLKRISYQFVWHEDPKTAMFREVFAPFLDTTDPPDPKLDPGVKIRG